jgi:phage-related holin
MGNMPNQSILKDKKPVSMHKYLEYDFWLGYFYAGIAWAGSFLAPLWPFIVFMIFLICADLITGTKAARKRKEKITSGGFRRTVEKFVLYFLAILAAEGMTQVYLPAVPLAYMVSFTIALTEFKSVLENIESATGVGLLEAIKSRIKLPKK